MDNERFQPETKWPRIVLMVAAWLVGILFVLAVMHWIAASAGWLNVPPEQQPLLFYGAN